MRRLVRTVPAVVASMVLVACGGSDLSPGAASRLQHEVAELRGAAAAGDADAAERELDQLRTLVDDLLRADEISEQRAREILDAAAAVEEELPALEPPPPPPPPAEDDEDDDEDGEGRGRGRGRGKKDD